MPEWFENEYSTWQDYKTEYIDWRKEYNLESAKYANDIFYQLDLEPNQRQKHNMVRGAMRNLSKEELRHDADNFIKQQNLYDLIDGRNPKEKLEKIKETAKVNGIEINTFELDFLIAESLQLIDAGQDPGAEYYDWVEMQHNIEININSNGTTQSEVDARDAFLYLLDERETEMRRIMALYAGASVYGNGIMKELASERYGFMTYKMSELRRLRTRTEATKNRADTLSMEEKVIVQSQKIASRALAAGTAAMLHEEMTDSYLRKKYGRNPFERSIAKRFKKNKKSRETKNRAETKRRISIIKNNIRNMRKLYLLLKGYRNGLSQEEQEQEELELEQQALNLEQHHLRMEQQNHFTMERYSRLSNGLQ